MQCDIGGDSQTKLIHSVAITPANVHDSKLLGDLLHGTEIRVWGDSAYSGQEETLQVTAPQAQNFNQKKGSRHRQLTEQERSANRYKSKVRAKVEPAFGVLKRQFGYNKVRYRGLDKNAHAVFTKCALVSLVLARKYLRAV